MIELYQLYRRSYYIKKLLTIRRENTFTLQPTKENYWKNALYKEETLIKNSKRKWPKQAMGSFLAKTRKAYIVLSILNLSEEISTSYEKYVNMIQTNGNNTWTIRTVDLC